MIRSALFSVLTDIGTPSLLDCQQIADQRRAISAFGVGLTPSATESTPEVVQHEVSVSLGIVGHNGWGLRLTSPSLDRAILCEVDPVGISSQSPVRFRSGRLWRPERHGRACCRKPAVLFLPAMPRVILLVFLLVSAAIDDENFYKFKWLSY
jgi:hypothetical protein